MTESIMETKQEEEKMNEGSIVQKMYVEANRGPAKEAKQFPKNDRGWGINSSLQCSWKMQQPDVRMWLLPVLSGCRRGSW